MFILKFCHIVTVSLCIGSSYLNGSVGNRLHVTESPDRVDVSTEMVTQRERDERCIQMTCQVVAE